MSGSLPDSPASREIRDLYTESYFTGDCGGFEFVGNTEPLRIDDARLRGMAATAELLGGTCALDIGCGRGEITGYLLARGWTVDAIDYSEAAIALTRAHVARCALDESRLRLTQTDANAYPYEDGRYDVAIASDVVEHLSPSEADELFGNVARSLCRSGRLIVHTFPNHWYYRFGWPRRRAAASLLGELLPADPRSAYERAMHINEQSPKALWRSLASRFAHVSVWLGSPVQPFAVSVERATREQLRSFPDLFAIAGHTPIADPAASPLFSGRPFANDDRQALAIRRAGDLRTLARAQVGLRVEVSNGSARPLTSFGSAPLFLSYRLLDGTGQTLPIEGARTPILPAILPGASATFDVRIDANDERAHFARITLVQEGVSWFDGEATGFDVDLVTAVG